MHRANNAQQLTRLLRKITIFFLIHKLLSHFFKLLSDLLIA